MKFLRDFNLANKVVLLRADVNSDVVNGRVLMSERIKETAETIKILKKKKAKVVVIAHQGRPGGEDFVSLRQHSRLLNKFTKIKFVEDIYGEKAEFAIKNLKQGEAILLENLRFVKDEFNPGKNKMVEAFSSWCDIYVNDAFSNSHRKHASMVELPKHMKHCAGPLLEKELKALDKIKIKRALYILGGAKPEDNLKLLGKNKVLACGLFGQMCLIAKGFKFGAQEKYLRKNVKDFDKIVKILKGKLKNIVTPVDFAVKINGKRVELNLNEFPSKYEIFDIGKKTQRLYGKEIHKAKAIYMKGPAGFCGDKRFCDGTVSLLRAISKNRGFSLLGGGHLSDAIKISGISKNKFGHISLSGGALLSYIAGEKLPGIEALK